MAIIASVLGTALRALFAVFFMLAGAHAAEPPFSLPPKNEVLKLKSATILTNRGAMTFELFPEVAPWHVANFKYLADKGFYRNLSFHAYFPNYLIQGGRFGSSVEGGPGYSLPPEFSDRRHVFGTLGMVRRKDFANPGRESLGSQFHILLSDARQMDRRYTIFGQLASGEEVLRSLRQGDAIEDVKVYVRVAQE